LHQAYEIDVAHNGDLPANKWLVRQRAERGFLRIGSAAEALRARLQARSRSKRDFSREGGAAK